MSDYRHAVISGDGIACLFGFDGDVAAFTDLLRYAPCAHISAPEQIGTCLNLANLLLRLTFSPVEEGHEHMMSRVWSYHNRGYGPTKTFYVIYTNFDAKVENIVTNLPLCRDAIVMQTWTVPSVFTPQPFTCNCDVYILPSEKRSEFTKSIKTNGVFIPPSCLFRNGRQLQYFHEYELIRKVIVREDQLNRVLLFALALSPLALPIYVLLALFDALNFELLLDALHAHQYHCLMKLESLLELREQLETRFAANKVKLLAAIRHSYEKKK